MLRIMSKKRRKRKAIEADKKKVQAYVQDLDPEHPKLSHHFDYAKMTLKTEGPYNTIFEQEITSNTFTPESPYQTGNFAKHPEFKTLQSKSTTKKQNLTQRKNSKIMIRKKSGHLSVEPKSAASLASSSSIHAHAKNGKKLYPNLDLSTIDKPTDASV